jgi:hypothetical protein
VSLAIAAWLAFATGDGLPGTTRVQLLVGVLALTLALSGVIFYLTAAASSVRLRPGDTEGERETRIVRRIRSRSRFGAGLTITAAVTVVGLGVLRIATPPAERPVSVQFSNLDGRVQFEFCPDLPGSFEALVKPAELDRSSTLLPVWVASRVCGNPSFQSGVWLYLDRSSITVADAGDR